MNDIQVFSTCPASNDTSAEEYHKRVIDVARWSEEAGCRGILVYTDNRLVDPWLVSQLIIQNTEFLSPLVAVQPAYFHPYSVAKMVSTLSFLYGRRMFLNMVAGGFRNDLLALGDSTPHDDRYRRLVEYTRIIDGVLRNKTGVSLDGNYYQVTNLKMSPPLSEELQPGIMISGSSEAGLEAARNTSAIAIKYPLPRGEEKGPAGDHVTSSGVRVGIVARENSDTAWEVARARFPTDRKGEIAHQLAMKVSDSKWHQQLSKQVPENNNEVSPYWLIPFQHYKTFCPYLVGSYSQVADEIACYISLGYRTFILDIPPNQEELNHIGEVFRLAQEEVARV